MVFIEEFTFPHKTTNNPIFTILIFNQTYSVVIGPACVEKLNAKSPSFTTKLMNN